MFRFVAVVKLMIGEMNYEGEIYENNANGRPILRIKDVREIYGFGVELLSQEENSDMIGKAYDVLPNVVGENKSSTSNIHQ